MAKQTFTTGQVLTAAQMTSLQQTAMGGGSPSTKTTSYVLTAADAGTVIQMNSASATTITVNTSLFAAGDSVQIQNINTGVVTITAGTATVNSAGSLALSQWEGGFLYFTSASTAIFFDVVDSIPTSYGFTAGKNKIINGDFSVWQRGTSFTPAANAYTADRWEEDATTAYPTSQTISRQTFTPGTAPVAGYEGQYFLRFAYTYATGNGGQFITQKIENVQTFAGQTVTISFWAKAGSAINMDNAVIRQNFGSGGSSTVQTTVGAASLTTSWQRFSFTVSVPSISGKTIGTNSFLELRLLMPTTSSTTDIWGVQMESGSTATAFQTATGTIQGELAACQRYYWRAGDGTGGAYGILGTSGYTSSTTNSNVIFVTPVRMRVAPTTLDYSAFATNRILNIGAPFTATAASITSNSTTPDAVWVQFTSSGMTASQFSQFTRNNDATAFIGFSSEL